jgi:hypothetical protein
VERRAGDVGRLFLAVLSILLVMTVIAGFVIAFTVHIAWWR